MRVVIIYHLHDYPSVSDEQAAKLKVKLKADCITSLKVDHQREHVQYPFIDIIDFDLEEKE